MQSNVEDAKFVCFCFACFATNMKFSIWYSQSKNETLTHACHLAISTCNNLCSRNLHMLHQYNEVMINIRLWKRKSISIN